MSWQARTLDLPLPSEGNTRGTRHLNVLSPGFHRFTSSKLFSGKLLWHTQTQQNTCTKVGCHICLLLCRMHELMPETSNAVQWLHFKNGIICTVSKLIKHAKDIRKQSSEHIYFAHGSGYELLWYVCLCVCLSARISPEPHTWSLPNFFVHVAYVRGLVLLWHVDDRPHRRSAGRGEGSAQCGRSVIYDCLVYLRSLISLFCYVSLL